MKKACRMQDAISGCSTLLHISGFCMPIASPNATSAAQAVLPDLDGGPAAGLRSVPSTSHRRTPSNLTQTDSAALTRVQVICGELATWPHTV